MDRRDGHGRGGRDPRPGLRAHPLLRRLLDLRLQVDLPGGGEVAATATGYPWRCQAKARIARVVVAGFSYIGLWPAPPMRRIRTPGTARYARHAPGLAIWSRVPNRTRIGLRSPANRRSSHSALTYAPSPLPELS